MNRLIFALDFAARKHRDQRRKDVDASPYINHPIALANVLANEAGVDEEDVLIAAILHDTLEDTSTTYDELEREFGTKIAKAVHALTKNTDLPKEQQMKDSLKRIKSMSPEVWAVKLADRITNLQPPPPHWDNDRKIRYREEAGLILSELKDGNEFLAKRLEEKIEEYGG